MFVCCVVVPSLNTTCNRRSGYLGTEMLPASLGPGAADPLMLVGSMSIEKVNDFTGQNWQIECQVIGTVVNELDKCVAGQPGCHGPLYQA